jgi:hypothetical protein
MLAPLSELFVHNIDKLLKSYSRCNLKLTPQLDTTTHKYNQRSIVFVVIYDRRPSAHLTQSNEKLTNGEVLQMQSFAKPFIRKAQLEPDAQRHI